MNNTELLKALRRQHVMCAGFESDDLATDREAALDYYHMRPNGTEIAGRSTVVSGDVSASVESNLAAMMEAFSSPNLAAFDPMGSEDVDQAQLESDAVVDFVMRQAAGRWQLAQAIKETLQTSQRLDEGLLRRGTHGEGRGILAASLPRRCYRSRSGRVSSARFSRTTPTTGISRSAVSTCRSASASRA